VPPGVPCCDKTRGRRTPSRLDARLAKRPQEDEVDAG
jgi:hypothetical protein